MEKTKRTSFAGNSLTPIDILEGPAKPQDAEILKSLARIHEDSRINLSRWQALRDEDLQLTSSLINLSDKPKQSDVEVIDEFYENLHKQSVKIANFLSSCTEVVGKQSNLVSDIDRLRNINGISENFRWKTLTLRQLYQQQDELFRELKQECEIKSTFYGKYPHCCDKSELEIYRSLLKYPEKIFNFRIIANTFVESVKS